MNYDQKIEPPAEPPAPQAQPQPLPKQEESKRLKLGKELLVAAVAVVLLLAVAAGFVVFALSAGRSPREVVDRGAIETAAVQEEVAMVSLPANGEKYAYFYISEGGLSCALLKRNASGFKLVDTAGEIALSNPSKPGAWEASLQGDKKSFFVFGIIYDDAIRRVEVDGQPAMVVDTGEYRCWYFYSQETLSIKSESVEFLK